MEKSFVGFWIIENAKTSLNKYNSGTIQPIGWGIKGVNTFPKGISLKMNVIAWLGFELAYL